jgi:hypothetical protein
VSQNRQFRHQFRPGGFAGSSPFSGFRLGSVYWVTRSYRCHLEYPGGQEKSAGKCQKSWDIQSNIDGELKRESTRIVVRNLRMVYRSVRNREWLMSPTYLLLQG